MEKNISFGDKQISYQVEGSGKTLVFIHGFLESRLIWSNFSRDLSSVYQVIAIDMPGFGKSDCIGEVHSMELMAEIVKQVLYTERVSSCLFIGHSMGGYVGAAFAEMYPECVSGLVFFHSHAAADSEETKVNRTKTIELVKKDALRFIVSFIPLLFAEENVERYQEKIAQLQQMASSISAQAVVAALAGMRQRNDHRDLLKTLEVPVLFLIGKQDSRISLESILPQIQLPKHAEALILDGVGHMGFVEAENITREVIKGFAQRVLND